VTCALITPFALQISPGTCALIAAEMVSSLGPSLPISDCEAEAYMAHLQELRRLQVEAAAEHARELQLDAVVGCTHRSAVEAQFWA